MNPKVKYALTYAAVLLMPLTAVVCIVAVLYDALRKELSA